MRPIVTDVAWSVSVCLYWSKRSRGLIIGVDWEKKLNEGRCENRNERGE